MAPNLAASQNQLIRDMIVSKSLPAAQMADVAGCSIRSFGTVKAPWNGGGGPRSVTPLILDALLEHFLEKPDQYLDEMILFLLDEFEVFVSASAVSRALKAARWSMKTCRRVAKGCNADLRNYYIYRLSTLRSYQLVYVDESGCDKWIGFRRTGWSPLGTIPVQIARHQREQRYQILPACTQDGVLVFRVFQGTTDSALFIEQPLYHCRPYPELNSVLVMDNASFHHTERIEQMCAEAVVKSLYLPPYSPDLKPIEEFSTERKAFIKK
jgi:transposase